MQEIFNDVLLKRIRENDTALPKKLDFAGTKEGKIITSKLSNEQVESLAAALRDNQDITELDLQNNDLNSQAIGAILSCPYLKTIAIYRGNNFGVDNLKVVLANNNLTKFVVGTGGVKKEHRALLSQITSHINSLNIGLNDSARRLVGSYQPYTITLQTVFLPHFNNSQVQTNSTRYSIEGYNQRRVSYLTKSVTQKHKVGQDNFLDLASWFLRDLDHAQQSNETFIFYAIIVLNLFAHNSSYYPAQGYGKALIRECQTILKYYRSQSNHPHRELIDSLLRGVLSKTGKSNLPRNEEFIALLRTVVLRDEFVDKLDKLDEFGFKTDNKSTKELSLYLGYSGSRLNNPAIYFQTLKLYTVLLQGTIASILKTVFTGKNIGASAISSVKEIENLKKLPNQIVALFSWLKSYVDKLQYYANLQDLIVKYRNTQADKIVHGCNNAFKHLAVFHPDDAAFIIINLYPELPNIDGIKNSRNYKEGLTNVLLGFLGGLINHNAYIRHLHIFGQRRQSFGSLRPTITDVGSMRIRLSLGLDSEIFNSIVITSLHQLDEILDNYNFISLNKRPIIQELFKPCENAQGETTTDKTGNYLLAAMRSDDDKWIAPIAAQNYLTSSLNKTGANSNLYLHEAFYNYLENFILARVLYQKVNNKKDHEKITYNGYSFKQEYVKPTSPIVTGQRPIILYVLSNVFKYTVDYVMNIISQKNTNSISYLLPHSFWHTLWKLFKNCDKANLILLYSNELEETHLIAKANLLIENILEYLISLKYLARPSNSDLNGDSSCQAFQARDKNFSARTFNIAEERVSVFYADSGQQSITSSIIAMDMQIFFESATIEKKQKKYLSDRSVYLFDESYFELEYFFEKVGGLLSKDMSTATIFFIDITRLSDVIKSLNDGKLPNAKVIIIDITNNSVLVNKKLKDLVAVLEKKGIWVVLNTSLIKHEELGLDKYQVGRTIIISPIGKELMTDVKRDLDKISKLAANLLTISYLEIVQGIYQTTEAEANANVVTAAPVNSLQQQHSTSSYATTTTTLPSASVLAKSMGSFLSATNDTSLNAKSNVVCLL